MSSVLCKEHFCYKFHEKFIYIRMLPWNTGALPPYFRDPPQWHRGSAADSRGRTVVYRDAPGHTVAPPDQTVALPGHTVINVCPTPGLVRSTAGNLWTHSNSVPICHGSPRPAGCKLPGRSGAYTGTVWTRLKWMSYDGLVGIRNSTLLLIFGSVISGGSNIWPYAGREHCQLRGGAENHWKQYNLVCLKSKI